jgi:hypothetical protein
MSRLKWMLIITSIALWAGLANAEESAESTQEDGESNGPSFGIYVTIGEGMIFIHSDVYRSPVSLEAVPSLGWSWFKFDLGLYTTLEDLPIADSSAGHWNFTFRPGARLTPPIIPLYFRAAIPLQIQADDFDWGFLFGVGLDFHLFAILGLVLEVDTTLTQDLEWGEVGVPLEFRAGVSLQF